MVKLRPAPIAALSLVLAACSQPDEPPAVTPEIAAPPLAAVIARSQAVCESTAVLQQRVTAFLNAPSEESLSHARDSWVQAHDAYRLLHADYLAAQLALPQQADDRDPIDAWPMLPGYLDSVPGYPHSGLVFSEVPLTPEALAREHQSTDFAYLTRGFHPLEFMLWGNDDNAATQAARFFSLAGVAKEGPDNDADAIDSNGRRQDLTRLIANTLKRDSQVFCTVEEQTRLSTALATTGMAEQLATDPALTGHEPPEPLSATASGEAVTGSEESGE